MATDDTTVTAPASVNTKTTTESRSDSVPMSKSTRDSTSHTTHHPRTQHNYHNYHHKKYRHKRY